MNYILHEIPKIVEHKSFINLWVRIKTLARRNWRCFFLLILAISSVFVFWIQSEKPLSSYEGKDLSAILKMMPGKDKERLEYFFQNLIGWDAFGYVLFGEKPMSFGSSDHMVNPFRNLSSFYFAISPRRIKSQKGFETWKKYEKLFPISRFVFLYDESSSNVTFLFVNKKNFIQTVQQHAADFKRVLNRDVTGEELLKEGANRSFLSEVLANQDELIGILFGFGRDNAFLFHQRSRLSSEKEQTDFCEKFNFGDPWEKEEEELDKGFESVGWVSAYITGSHLKNLDFITLPGFCAILDHPETLYLKQQYLEARKRIINYYKDQDFLEATLRALIE